MSSRTILVCLAATAWFTAGCGKKETAPAVDAAAAPAPTAAAVSPAPAPAPAPASAPAPAGPLVLELTANDTMKFNLTRLEAPAGATIQLVLRNTGALPKAAMGHNVVVLKAGVSVEQFVAASIAAGPAKDYFPADRVEQTIAHTKLIGPREKAEVTFQAPTEAGEYPYVCTFPGHLAAGMKGVLVIK